MSIEDDQVRMRIQSEISANEISNMKNTLEVHRDWIKSLESEVKQMGKVVYLVVVIGVFMSIAVAPFIRDWVVSAK